MSWNDWFQWAGIVLGLVLSGFNLWLAYKSGELSRQQTAISERAEARASGKIKAKFEYVGIGNTDEKSTAPRP